jgi:hypothetical protein
MSHYFWARVHRDRRAEDCRYHASRLHHFANDVEEARGLADRIRRRRNRRDVERLHELLYGERLSEVRAVACLLEEGRS